MMVCKIIKSLFGSVRIVAWKHKGLSKKKSLNLLPTQIIVLLWKWLLFTRPKTAMKFECICLKLNITSFSHENIANLFIVYELNISSGDKNTRFRIGNYLFRAIKLTNNVDPYKYGYRGYGIRFDIFSQFSLPVGK